MSSPLLLLVLLLLSLLLLLLLWILLLILLLLFRLLLLVLLLLLLVEGTIVLRLQRVAAFVLGVSVPASAVAARLRMYDSMGICLFLERNRCVSLAKEVQHLLWVFCKRMCAASRRCCSPVTSVWLGDMLCVRPHGFWGERGGRAEAQLWLLGDCAAGAVPARFGVLGPWDKLQWRFWKPPTGLQFFTTSFENNVSE